MLALARQAQAPTAIDVSQLAISERRVVCELVINLLNRALRRCRGLPTAEYPHLQTRDRDVLRGFIVPAGREVSVARQFWNAPASANAAS
jgi:hypothetical protein